MVKKKKTNFTNSINCAFRSAMPIDHTGMPCAVSTADAQARYR